MYVEGTGDNYQPKEVDSNRVGGLWNVGIILRNQVVANSFMIMYIY